MCNNKEAIALHRPRSYAEFEHAEMRRNSSVNPRMLWRSSRVLKKGSMSLPEDEFVEKM